jgi:hypothetical protein
MIIKQDGTTKNDCERNAAKRFFEQLRKDHPHLPLIVNEDALSPSAPHICHLKKHNLHYILGVKPGNHKFLFHFVEDAAQDGRTNEFEIEDKENPDITHRFRILNEVPLNQSNQELLVNFIEYWEHSKETDKITYHNTRPLQNAPFCPITASGLNFNPRNIQHIPPVEIFAFLVLEQN